MLLWFIGMIESIYGAPIDRLDLLEIDPMELRTENAVPHGGFQTLIEEASKGLQIRSGNAARRIVYRDEGVWVETDQGSVKGDVVLVTLPLGVLKSGEVVFDPPLDPEKRAAIDRVGYGEEAVLNKVALRFDQPFWPVVTETMATLPSSWETKGTFRIWVDMAWAAQAPVLVGFTSGRIGAGWDIAASDQAILQEAMAVLRRMFRKVPSSPTAYRITRWLKDPWALGSYSFRSVETLPEDFQRLAQPVGRLFFAGEATHPERYSTLDGALLSGEREALRIHRIFCCPRADVSHLPWRA